MLRSHPPLGGGRRSRTSAARQLFSLVLAPVLVPVMILALLLAAGPAKAQSTDEMLQKASEATGLTVDQLKQMIQEQQGANTNGLALPESTGAKPPGRTALPPAVTNPPTTPVPTPVPSPVPYAVPGPVPNPLPNPKEVPAPGAPPAPPIISRETIGL